MGTKVQQKLGANWGTPKNIGTSCPTGGKKRQATRFVKKGIVERLKGETVKRACPCVDPKDAQKLLRDWGGGDESLRGIRGTWGRDKPAGT